MASTQGQEPLTLEQQAEKYVKNLDLSKIPKNLLQSSYTLGAIAAGADPGDAVEHGARISSRLYSDEALRRQSDESGMMYTGALTWLQQQEHADG